MTRRLARHSRPGRIRPALAAVSVPVALIFGGCSAAAPPISPAAGVDGLIIPTPDPAVSAFTDRVDNAWFPLPPGSVRRYRALGDTSGNEATATVIEGPVISGISTVGLRTTLEGSTDPNEQTVDYYAQDDSGNVWWFGREGQWRAGESEAQAGLVMAARPRLGDGYRQGLAPGVTEPQGEVLMVGERFTTAARTYDDVVAVKSQDSAGSGDVSYYAPGVGLIRREVANSATGTLELIGEPTER